HVYQESTVALVGKSHRVTMSQQAYREIVDQAEDLVCLALAAGEHQRLLPPQRPRVGERAPLREAGFVAKEQQGAALPGQPDDGRPLRGQPGAPALLIEVIGDEARLLEGEAQIAQQGADIMRV